MGNYLPTQNWIGFHKETAFRCGNGGTQTTPTALAATTIANSPLAFDNIEEAIDLVESWLKQEESYVLGGGQLADKLTPLGYDLAEQDLPLKKMTGIFEYYFLGSCTTTGTAAPTNGTFTGFATTTIVVTAAAGSYTFTKNALAGMSVKLAGATTVYRYIVSHAATSASTLTLVLNDNSPATGANTCQFFSTDAGTATIKAGSQGTATMTVTDLGTLASNGSMVGKVIATSETNTPKYLILANTAVSGAEMVFTLDRALGAAADGKTVTFYTYPYTHAITEADTNPSFMLHQEKTLSSYDILRDIYGCLCNKLEITIEKGAVVSVAVGVKGARSGTGTDATQPTAFTEEYYRWDHVSRTSVTAFTYDGTAVEGSIANFLNECSKVVISLTRDIEVEKVLGDEYAYKVKYGKREYEITCTYTPTTNTLFLLKNTKLNDYTGPLVFALKLLRGDGSYISYSFSSLYLSEYPDKLSVIEDMQTEVEFKLRNAPSFKDNDVTAAVNAKGSLTISVVDDHSGLYYEGFA